MDIYFDSTNWMLFPLMALGFVFLCVFVTYFFVIRVIRQAIKKVRQPGDFTISEPTFAAPTDITTERKH